MRKVFRNEHNQAYWDRRWAEAGRDGESFASLDIYPVRYAEMIMDRAREPVLELGSGLGRVVKHYRRQGRRVFGLERSSTAIRALAGDPDAGFTVQADVLDLPFADSAFGTVMAFGLYHNIEHGLDRALAETARVLRDKGGFCISMRPDNLEMRLNERYWRWRSGGGKNQARLFHKWLVGEEEFARVLAGHGLRVTSVHRARNLSILYRIPLLRRPGRTESENRSRGYRLNALGEIMDRALTGIAPGSFCNVLVFLGVKDVS